MEADVKADILRLGKRHALVERWATVGAYSNYIRLDVNSSTQSRLFCGLFYMHMVAQLGHNSKRTGSDLA